MAAGSEPDWCEKVSVNQLPIDAVEAACRYVAVLEAFRAEADPGSVSLVFTF